MLAPAPNPLSFIVTDFLFPPIGVICWESYMFAVAGILRFAIYIAVSYPPYFLSADFSGNAHINNYFRIKHIKIHLTYSVLQVI